MPAGSSVFDCCCGCGGNAIAFARRCAVTAIDVSSDRVALARRNAKIYGVDVRVDVGDALRDERTADVLFVDAPWGREWDKERTDLDSLPLLRDVLAAARSIQVCSPRCRRPSRRPPSRARRPRRF